MILSMIPSGSSVFLDANILVYAFAPDPQFGPSCEQLLERIEQRDLSGFTSSQVLSDVAHRLMSLEACATFGWPYTGIVRKMLRHPAEVQKLTRFRDAIKAIPTIGINVLPVSGDQVQSAAALSQQLGLLSNDALILAVMQDVSLTQLVSHDSDFDRVSWICRFGLT